MADPRKASRPYTRKLLKKKLRKKTLPFDSTILNITTTDIALMGPDPGDIKLTGTRYPFTPSKVFRGKTSSGKRNAYSLSGVKRTKAAAMKLATKGWDQGWDIGRAKTRDGYAVYIANTRTK